MIAYNVLSKTFFFIINIIHCKLRNRLLYKNIDKLEFISINTRTRAREDIEMGAEIIEEERAKCYASVWFLPW